jgi:hypothetical protein
MKKLPKIFASRFHAVLLSVLLFLVLFNYGALSYFREALSGRDYSMIPDPKNRVAYCIVSSISNSDKNVLAETTAHPPDFDIYSKVMSQPQQTLNRKEVQIAIGALRKRDDLRQRAHKLSHAAAAACGFWQVKWPTDISPLDVSLKWLQFDSTYSRLVDSFRSNPDAAQRLWIELTRKPQKQADSEIRNVQ